MRVWIPVFVTLSLIGCSKPSVPADAAGPPPEARAKEKAAPADKTTGPTVAPMLAYSYDEGLQAPASRIPALVARHQHACVEAGPAVCQVTGSNIQAQGRDNIYATLTLRASPAWLVRFESSLADDARAADGRLSRDKVTSEDLSRRIVDTEAAIKAKTALRDRLQALLETHPGKLSDLLDVENALSQAQDNLDATQSELALMRERVATSVMTVEYQSTGFFAPDGLWSPLGSAMSDFLKTVVDAFAIMVRVVAWFLPWALVVGGLAWLWRKAPWKARAPRKQTPTL